MTDGAAEISLEKQRKKSCVSNFTPIKHGWEKNVVADVSDIQALAINSTT